MKLKKIEENMQNVALSMKFYSMNKNSKTILKPIKLTNTPIFLTDKIKYIKDNSSSNLLT